MTEKKNHCARCGLPTDKTHAIGEVDDCIEALKLRVDLVRSVGRAKTEYDRLKIQATSLAGSPKKQREYLAKLEEAQAAQRALEKVLDALLVESLSL